MKTLKYSTVFAAVGSGRELLMSVPVKAAGKVCIIDKKGADGSVTSLL